MTDIKKEAGVFVFVVCGGREHIETLHFALKAIQRFSKCKVLVVTDNYRNEIPVQHPNIVNVKVDPKLDHHQASIFLKTSLHKILPKGQLYCYLDTDVIAVSKSCDQIFENYVPPITFAPDHCKMKKFSSYAVNCDCMEKWSKDRKKWEHVYAKIGLQPGAELDDKRKEFYKKFSDMDKDILLKVRTIVRYFTSGRYFNLTPDFIFDKKEMIWRDQNGEIIEIDYRRIQRETGFKYDKNKKTWYNKEGHDIWRNECDHLQQAIKETFEINVTENNWQHWNGGVFLFSNESHTFMDTWHELSKSIWDDPYWKTRDQGTLIATVWKLGLQNHPTLSKKWNFIADYHNPELILEEDGGTISDDQRKTNYSPAFMHIYHHFGDEGWKVWRWVLSKVEEQAFN